MLYEGLMVSCVMYVTMHAQGADGHRVRETWSSVVTPTNIKRRSRVSMSLKCPIIDFGQRTFEPATLKIADLRWPSLGSTPPMGQGR